MNRRKIILFFADISHTGVPLPLLALSKLIDTQLFDIRIITAVEYPNYEDEILRHASSALCVGISCITGKPIKEAIKVSKIVKNKFPETPIIWGGWQAITLPEVTLASPYVDYICTGQGESTFFEFVEMLNKKDFSSLKNIKGLSYKLNNKIVHNENRPIEDLNIFPDYNLDLINWEKYLEITDFAEKTLRIDTSYGCPYRCSFCCEPNNSSRKWKALSAERVNLFLDKLKKRVDFDGLMIVDSNFFVNQKRTIDILTHFIENDYNIKIGQVNGRTNDLIRYKKSTWELLEKAGLYNVLIGAESIDDGKLEFINKDATAENTYKLVGICKSYNIKLVASLMAGIPTPDYFENNPERAFEKEFKSIRNFCRDISDIDKNNHPLIFCYTPLPFSALYDVALERGFSPPQTLNEWADYDLLSHNANWVTKKQFKRLSTLSHCYFIKSVDLSYLLNALPKVLSLPIGWLFFVLKLISKFRLKNNLFSFPIDMYFFNFGIKAFGKLNKIFKLVNI